MSLIRTIFRLISSLRRQNQELARIALALESISTSLRPKAEPPALSPPAQIRPAQIHRIETRGTWW